MSVKCIFERENSKLGFNYYGSLMLGKINLRAGFNFQRREDLKLTSSFNMSGFSFGLGFSIKKIQINYARSAYHSSSMINSFSIVTNLSNFGL